MEEVLENVGGHEAYSFTGGFSGYHQIKITQIQDHVCDIMWILSVHSHVIWTEEHTNNILQSGHRNIQGIHPSVS